MSNTSSPGNVKPCYLYFFYGLTSNTNDTGGYFWGKLSGADRADPPAGGGYRAGQAAAAMSGPRSHGNGRPPPPGPGRLTIERGLQLGREDAPSAASLRATLWFLFRVAHTAAAEGQAAEWRRT